MRRLFFAVAGFAAACGGSTAFIGPDIDASSPGNDAATTTNDGALPDDKDAGSTPPERDAGTDGLSIPDAPPPPPGDGGSFDGLAPDPGKIRCGSMSCNTPALVCCASGDGGTCTNQQQCDFGRPLACDETGDCANGVCCIHPGQAPFPLVTSACQATCIQGAITFQACKTSQECVGSLCVAQKCGGIWFGTCGGIPSNMCP